jgi:hypothetical protein
MTCRHCVKEDLPPKHTYGGVVLKNNQAICYPLTNIERDHNGTDIALAAIDLLPKAGFMLSAEAFFPGADVFTYGFPLTEKIRLEEGEPAILALYRGPDWVGLLERRRGIVGRLFHG